MLCTVLSLFFPGMGKFFIGEKEFFAMESTGYMYNEYVKPGNLEDKGR